MQDEIYKLLLLAVEASTELTVFFQISPSICLDGILLIVANLIFFTRASPPPNTIGLR